MYSWWNKPRGNFFWRTYGGDVEIRRWVGRAAHENPLTGHHVGLYGQMTTYDFAVSRNGSLADRWSWGAGISYGYSHPVGRRLNLDFTIGVGYFGGKYKKYKLASGKTAKSILISCGARLAPFDIPQLREIMSYDELELDKLGDEKSALFFLISDTDTTYNFLVALAFSQMFNLLCERADNTYGGRLPYHVRVLWDEAANTGQVPGLEKIVAVIRSREISLTLFYQAMSQCKALYKDHSETIMGNMDSIVFLGGREASTLKDISENWLGKATISMQTEGRSRGQSESYSQNMQRLGRELMTTSEITTMPGDKCILQLRGLPPFLSPKYDLKKHPNYKYTAEFDKKKNAFRLESLFRHRPLRLKPEDEYTVYEVDGSDTDEEADLLNFDDLDSDEFV